jgi:transcriptional regulator with XRE-family HTH domain
MKTADRIKVLLRARGVEERQIRKELASLCGLTKQGVGQWWISTETISPVHLAKIANRYKTTMEWLVTGKGEMDITAADAAVNIELDELIGALYTRREEFTAEQFAALQALIEGLERRATARFEKLSQDTDK